MPIARTWRVNASPYTLSRSRMRECGALSQPHASVTCWAIHSALGCAVTPSHRMRLRSCRRTSNPYSSRKEIVGTTKRSIEAIPSAWFRRNVLQPCDGGRRRRAMYLATEVWPTSMPRLRSSPWMRGAPQRGFARLISRISCRTSRGTLGLPGRRRDFQRQKPQNPARCHRIIVSGRTIVIASRTVGASRYSNMKIKRSNDLRAGVFTDEPFNVTIGGHVTGGDHREFVMASGEMTDAEFLDFNRKWMDAVLAHLVDGGILG